MTPIAVAYAALYARFVGHPPGSGTGVLRASAPAGHRCALQWVRSEPSDAEC